MGESLRGPKTSVWGRGCHISSPITGNKAMDGWFTPAKNMFTCPGHISPHDQKKRKKPTHIVHKNTESWI